MGDDLDDEWWIHDSISDASEVEEETQSKKQPPKKTSIKTTTKKRKKIITEVKTVEAKKKKKEKGECINSEKAEKSKQVKRRRKKKTITDILASSEPKPGSSADLQNLVVQYFSDKRSVIEQEELRLQDSYFLSCNDLTHSLSSYLKHICPKWAKILKQHTEKSSIVLLIVCSSAVRSIELIKQLMTFKGEAKVMKLFAKHIKVAEQVKLLQKGVTHIGVGTPGRISALIQEEGLSLQALRYLVLDWNWRDQKLRRMVDIPEVKVDMMKLLESGVLTACKDDKVKIGLF
ncbi:protein CMSS1 isoform X2 [Thalassophryne amazonica]|uniref:protein CMSS1 isoform X2 n=1 Tax=Thalassophryne amazonica TaxID=390379 RepID=UPI001470B42E|nr:protein CMSS1 isoform X2 [Thalassophryne amazonica]